MNEQALAMGVIGFGGRIYLRPMTADVSDGLLVSHWRNTTLARACFYGDSVVTPESHARFITGKDPHDQVWLAYKRNLDANTGIIDDWDDDAIGMTGLHIDPAAYVGEYGRTLVSERWQGQGYATEIEYTLLATAFEFFNLKFLWLEAFTVNEPVLKLHDKTGWVRAGVDVPRHTHPRGPVQYMTYERQAWAARRSVFYEMIGKDMPEWTP